MGMEQERLKASYLTILNAKEIRAVATMVGVNWRTIIAIRDRQIVPPAPIEQKICQAQYTCRYKNKLTQK